MENLVDLFVKKIIEKDELQKKYIENRDFSTQEKEEFHNVLKFFTEVYDGTGYDMDYIVDAYLFINNMVYEETYYFMVNGKYRNSTFKEVDAIVYNCKEYMEKHMIGLTISDYMWTNHIKMIRYFVNNLEMFQGDKYLEIGPGFGQYLIKAVLKGQFKEYFACDISPTSVKGSNQYLQYMNVADRCTVKCKDFFQYDSDEKFDCIVMGEVLEHVEQPLMMLQKIYDLLSESGNAFITTVINAPTIDHIFLFRTIEEVLGLMRKAKFYVVDYHCSTAGDIPLEKAVKKKAAITIAMILKK